VSEWSILINALIISELAKTRVESWVIPVIFNALRVVQEANGFDIHAIKGFDFLMPYDAQCLQANFDAL